MLAWISWATFKEQGPGEPTSHQMSVDLSRITFISLLSETRSSHKSKNVMMCVPSDVDVVYGTKVHHSFLNVA